MDRFKVGVSGDCGRAGTPVIEHRGKKSKSLILNFKTNPSIFNKISPLFSQNQITASCLTLRLRVGVAADYEDGKVRSLRNYGDIHIS